MDVMKKYEVISRGAFPGLIHSTHDTLSDAVYTAENTFQNALIVEVEYEIVYARTVFENGEFVK
jgi:hypothetical protein